MKKLLFRKFLKDTLSFFIIIGFSISAIVWVVQAVGFLDFVTEDGHSLYVYFLYSSLNYPKIIHRILPFVFFISLFYQLSQYEIKNELLLFWTNGISKINFINVIICYSFLVMVFQLFLGAYVSPKGQDEARSYLRNSNIDFFPSLIKEGKFIDTVTDLTIFIESQDESGNYKNIFLNDSSKGAGNVSGKRSKIIYAKRGKLISENKNRYFRLFDGQMITRNGERATNLEFEKIDFNLTKYETKTTTYPKIQETPSKDLFRCIYYNLNNKLEEFEAAYLKCEKASLNNIKQEYLKRFYKPIYIPLIALISCLLIMRSKESDDYSRFKFYLSIIIFCIIVVSEISLRYSTTSNIGLLFFFLFPIISFAIIYFSLIIKNNKILKI